MACVRLPFITIPWIPSKYPILFFKNNVVRCLLGAGMVSIVRPILDALDNGWTFVFFGGLCVLVSPLLCVEIRWGPFWRQRRGSKNQ